MIESHFTISLQKKRNRPKVSGLTRAEYEVLRALDQAIRSHGNPSLKEIQNCSTFRWPQMIHEYLRRLEAKGYVSVKRNQSRGIRMLRELPARSA